MHLVHFYCRTPEMISKSSLQFLEKRSKQTDKTEQRSSEYSQRKSPEGKEEEEVKGITRNHPQFTWKTQRLNFQLTESRKHFDCTDSTSERIHSDLFTIFLLQVLLLSIFKQMWILNKCFITHYDVDTVSSCVHQYVEAVSDEIVIL